MELQRPLKRWKGKHDEMTGVDWRKLREARKRAQKELKGYKFLKKLEKQRAKQQETVKEEEEKKEPKGRLHTVSVALPGSVLDNAQSPELRSYLAGQIARACTVFCVDEIVVFDEQGEDAKTVEGEFRGIGKKGHANVQLARILQYLECPQYLRKFFFPKHQDLQFAGLLNPLDSPHHVRIDEDSKYRDGVVVDRPSKPKKGSFVNCGLRKEVQIDRQLQAGLRVTVRLHKSEHSGAVFAECPFEDGYDLTIGTSEQGSNTDSTILPSFRHMLVVFGGLQGLEASVDADQNLELTDPSALFHHYLNTCPDQGTRAIRTEEAILITLSALRPKIDKALKGADSS